MAPTTTRRKSRRGWRARLSSRKSAKWFQNRVVPIGGGEPLFTHQIDQDTQVTFTTNHIRSSKYTIFNFWFLNLFEQFRRVANFYFLIVAIIQLSLPSPPVSPFTSVSPLIFVVVITMIKQGYEDFCRHRADRELNTAPVTLLRNGSLVTVRSQDIKVGDILRVENNEKFPADMVVLSTSSVTGRCFVMTANLDGETNLKPMSAARLTKHCRSPEQLSTVAGQIECEQPSPDLHNFLGRMKMKGREEMELCSLSLENLVMRGTQLRNTDYLFGCVVYTGKDSKMSQNSKSTANKFSTVEITMNKFLLIFMAILILEMVICTSLKYALGIDSPNSTRSDEDHYYLGGKIVIGGELVAQDFFSFLVLYNYIIPISLYVTLEMQKFFGSLFLTWDLELYDAETNEPAKCNSSDLNEELGQIQVLFSDKTGTLTENIMVFKEASINGRQYRAADLLAKPGSGSFASFSNEAKGRGASDEVDSVLEESFRDPQDEILITEFLSALAICHTVQTARKSKSSEADQSSKGSKGPASSKASSGYDSSKVSLLSNGFKNSIGLGSSNGLLGSSNGLLGSRNSNGIGSVRERNGHHAPAGIVNNGYQSSVSEGLDSSCSSLLLSDTDIEYNASSPDEKALVEACAKAGIAFIGDEETSGSSVKLHILDSRSGSPAVKTYTRLHVLEFDSTRKRMSVIVKTPCGKCLLVTKGAESSVLPRCREGALRETNQHIDEYALVGLRTLAIGSKELSDADLHQFETQLFEAQQALEGREAKIQKLFDEAEKGLSLLGATAVEDKLQYGVKETLVNLGLAGISVWILTGDKKETAINISYACGHLQPDLTVLDLTGLTSVTVTGKMERYAEQLESSQERYGLVVDGASLHLIMPVEDNRKLLFQVASKCQAVVCCRMSPLQKSEIVKMMKTSPDRPITAAIGDGGNDVAMIQEAHVGLGIMGKEGRAAVRAADFAFSKFHYLQKVILVHGHWYYYRVSLLVQYFFYKNVASFTCQFYYAFFNSFSTETLFDSVNLTLYNITFTSLPIFVFALLEQNLDKSDLLTDPFLYRRNYRNKLLSWKEFFAWLFQAVWHSVVLYFGWLMYFTYRTSAGGLSTNITSAVALDQTSFGTCIYSTVIALVNIRLLYQSRCWNLPLVLSILFSVLFYMGLTFFCHSVRFETTVKATSTTPEVVYSIPFEDSTFWVYYQTLSCPGVWLFTLLLLIVALIPDVVLRTLKKHYLALRMGLRETRDTLDERLNRGHYELDSVYVNHGFNSQEFFKRRSSTKDPASNC